MCCLIYWDSLACSLNLHMDEEQQRERAVHGGGESGTGHDGEMKVVPANAQHKKTHLTETKLTSSKHSWKQH